jgi:hypothetical protein
MTEAEFLFGWDGKRHAPYSIRHTYATMTISAKITKTHQNYLPDDR